MTDPIVTTITPPAVFTTIVTAAQGPSGPQGIQGPAGSMNVSKICTTDLSGHRAVIIDSSGGISYATNTNALHASRLVGVTSGASVAGATASVVSYGEITEPSWSWTVNVPVYLGANGYLTQTPPVGSSASFSVVIGFPIAATTLFIHIGNSIALTP